MTPPASPAAVEMTGVVKDYHGLRPLRIAHLSVPAGGRTALIGFDQPMAETFVNLVTGATLPDQGTVMLGGRPTSAINDSTEWLAVVDRFGIVSERAVLLPALSVVQNLSIPFTLEIDPPPEDIRVRAEQLATETGIEAADWPRAVGDLDPASHLRLRLARALALDPDILLLEHASAALQRAEVPIIGSRIREIASRRGLALLAVGADDEFALAVAARVLRLDQATGRLVERGRKWSFFRGGG